MHVGRAIVRLLGIMLLPAVIYAQQPGDGRPKIGVTLSGGGAKGLAHIGVLEALDSAGLKVDYLTGTSMGSIVGALYAMGYSGDAIEKMARELDWNSLFSNQPVLTDISYEEKKEYNKYIIEIPFEYGKPKLASGVISGEQLWLELARMCWPANGVRDFSKFNIPFKCIATDVSNGAIVTLDTGDVVMAIRASMAIPSIFTAVNYGDRKLVDGGVVRNFPVITAKEMGADIVIGSNVSGGLRKSDQLLTPIDVIQQLGFYKDADDFKEEIQLCDIFIQHDLEKYSAASFGSVDSIIEAGKRQGREMYPVFKHLADSLQGLYPQPPFEKDRLPFTADVELTAIHINGLKHSNEKFFRERLGLKTGGCYSREHIKEAVLNVFGTRFFKMITYQLEPQGGGKSVMQVNAEENPLTYVKVALSYNTFTNASAIVNITQRNFIVPNSRAFVSVAISENPRVLAEYFKYTGQDRSFGVGLGVYYEDNIMTQYRQMRAERDYRSKFFHTDIHFQYTLNSIMAMGVGTRYEFLNLNPRFNAGQELRGNTNQVNSYFYTGINSLDRKVYPRKGMDMQFEAGWIYNQHSNFRVYNDGVRQPLDSVGITFADYQRAMLQARYHIPIGYKGSIQIQAGGGINFNHNQGPINGFLIGGMNNVVRNQLPFVGILEGEVNTSSAATLQLAWQYEMFKNIFATPRIGAALYDFMGDLNSRYKYLSGYGISGGYSTFLGPVEGTVMYCDQDGRLRFYVNIGFNF